VSVRADLVPGDLVLAVVVKGRQTRLDTLADFEAIAAALGPGEQVTLLVQRANGTSYVSLRAAR
jgi:serine protease Do